MSFWCTVDRRSFGMAKSGREAWLYEVRGSGGMGFSVSDFGASLVSVWIPGPDGRATDVVLGYDSVTGYESNDGHLGAMVGRNANRIAKGRYELNGRIYRLAQNDRSHNLHSGPDYYGIRFWEAAALENGVRFALRSPDGDQGHPGNADILVEYILTEENGVRITWSGVCDQDTVMNLTNHSYFNLEGAEGKSILSHEMQIHARYFTAVDECGIPTGEIEPVAGTPMDFTGMKKIGRDIRAGYRPLILAEGYDHNYITDHPEDFRQVAAYQACGRRMEVYTDLPGLQVYTGNFLKAEGKNHAQYGQYSAVCFETQYYPNSINIVSFPSPELKKGETRRSVTEYRFVWQEF